jgi:dCTP deaminase
MYLSDRDIRWAVDKGTLIIRPQSKVDPTSIDLHLDRVEEAQIWNTAKFIERNLTVGVDEPEVHLGSFHYGRFSGEYLTSPPEYRHGDKTDKVCKRGNQVLVRPGGFLLWQTKEEVGTPLENAQYICFVDGKSTRARAGIVVHLTAPTIHAGWCGKIVLEIASLGPLTFVLQEDDVIAQLTVATISSIPQQTQFEAGSSTLGQISLTGGQNSS